MPVGQGGTEHSIGQRSRWRGGHNHGRAHRAIGRALALALAAIPLGASLLPASPALAQATPEENPLVQRGVPAEATAENAVVARDRALSSGQRIAYDRMASALGLQRGLSDSQIEGLVSSLVIESERITQRGYAARITVNFNPQRVAGGRAAPGAQGPAFGTPAPGGGQAGGQSGAQSGTQAGSPAVATVEAVARYRSLPEWVEITRRLGAAPSVARVEVVTVSGEAARVRLALRSQPPEAAAELAQGGLLLGPAPMDARPGEGWRLGLAGAR